MQAECGVCLYTSWDGDDLYDFSRRIEVSDKPHNCCECNKEIPVGTPHEYAQWKDSESAGNLLFDEARSCLICAEIAEAFYCEGRMYFSLWDDMDEVFEDLTTACLDKLKTAAAKAELLRRWSEWKFNQ